MATPNDMPGLHRMNPVMAYQKGKADGIKEATGSVRLDMLQWLEEKYMDPEIERDSPTAKALLTIAAEMSKEFRERGI